MHRSRLPAAGEGKRGADGYLSYLLRQASTTLRNATDRALADLDITAPQFSALLLIGAYEDLSSADLARLSLLTPQTINVIVRNLEARGAVTRRAHAVHGRVKVIELTEKGGKLLGECRRRADQLDAQIGSFFGSAAEEDVVRRWLVRVATGLDAPT